MRYTGAKRRNYFVSFISLTSIIGLALGVLVMIVVLSVMNGFDHEMRTRVLAMVPHALIESRRPINDWHSLAVKAVKNPQVLSVAPFTQIQGLLSRDGHIQKTLLTGIEPASEKKVSIINQFFTKGDLSNLKPGEFGITLGADAAKKLGVKVGEKITFVSPEISVTPAGIFPRLKRFTVVGIFKVGVGEIDGYFAMTQIQDLARLRHWQVNQVQGIRLKVSDLFQAPQISWQLAQRLGRGKYYAQDWTQTQGNLYQAIRMEKRIIGLLLMLIVAVAAFNIISTLVMVVNDKRGDIAILRTLGAAPKQIMAIFMVQGTIIGVFGTVIGAVLGSLLALNISTLIAFIEKIFGVHFLSSDVYFINYLPSKLMLSDVLLVCSVSLLLSFLATLYPAWRASCTQPAEVLRYE
ncbi:UNVERIFIED_CONTAM: hypothetical protein GTU68_005044 [Idotea baltica]|nr:hypothetical protein [Idotea baltica]